jgi:opacity protein-like surface antigen
MLRVFIGAVLALGLVAAGARADDKTKKDDANKKWTEAKITKVDSKNGTVTVKMKDEHGKDVEKTFHFTEDVHYWDSTGKNVTLDFFQAGNDVLVVEYNGKIKELKKNDKDHTSTPKK